MTTVDLHQHLWPAAFQDALRARSAPPHIDGDVLVTREGRFPFDPSVHEPTVRVALLDRDGIDEAVLTLQPTLGLETLAPAERDELELIWVDGIAAVLAEHDGRFRALAPGRVVDGLPGTIVGVSALLDLDSSAPLLDRVEASRGVLLVHPEADPVPGHERPPWWSWTVGYTQQMQQAYFAWQAAGRDRWPTLDVVFAILAGGAPFQLERLARRGVDVRSALDPNTFFDVATYGRRAIELCVETFGIDQLVYGSDTPVVDAQFTLHAVRGLGDAVARMLQIETPGSLVR